jgi:hypothetical protein
MKLLILVLLLGLISGCAHNAKLVRYERTGPVVSEVWKKNGKCEKRTYLDSMFFKVEVPCKA